MELSGRSEDRGGTASDYLRKVRVANQLRSLRIAAVLRLGGVVFMAGTLSATPRSALLPQLVALVTAYTLLALFIAATVFRPSLGMRSNRRQLAVVFTDLTVVTAFELMSPAGYIPLLMMGLVPLLVALEVSARRAGIVLAASLIAFICVLLVDPTIEPSLGWRETILVCLLFGFLCATAVAMVRVRERYIDAIAALSAARELLLTETMESFEAERKRIAESIHDGPLQLALAAGQDLEELGEDIHDVRLARAVTTLRQASQNMRDVTSVLHPAVLDRIGLAEAARKLATVIEARSALRVTVEADDVGSRPTDKVLFAVLRELMLNIGLHAKASQAWVHIHVLEGRCRLDIIDNGIGVTAELLDRRVAEGHIGVASNRARVEAIGGSLEFLDVAVGTHVRVDVPVPA